MAWRRPGDKPLSEPMIVSSRTHICVTWPQWVKQWSPSLFKWLVAFYIFQNFHAIVSTCKTCQFSAFSFKFCHEISHFNELGFFNHFHELFRWYFMLHLMKYAHGCCFVPSELKIYGDSWNSIQLQASSCCKKPFHDGKFGCKESKISLPDVYVLHLDLLNFSTQYIFNIRSVVQFKYDQQE